MNGAMVWPDPSIERVGAKVNPAPQELPQFRISGDSAVCQEVRRRGFTSFGELAEHVRSLPYGRTAGNEDLCGVLREGRGTCSSKHQLLAAIAHDCGHAEIRLTVGIYEMSEANTRGVGAVLGAAAFNSIPEAHCYLTVHGRRVDLTGLAPGRSSPFEALLSEQSVPVTGLRELKLSLHRMAIASWAAGHGVAPEAAWAVREACIVALTPNRSIERTSSGTLRAIAAAARVER